jgi:hypothetical protein
MPNDTYNSPFNARYASKEMQYIYSPDFKFKTWRKFCVAKIKVIAIEDGLSDEGEQEFDGPTYYAVVPESYLGKTTFKGGGGVYEECSWNYYGGTYAVVAEAESGKFTESEENDVIKFLSTFRQEYE